MKHIVALAALFLLLSAGPALVSAQSADPVTGQEGTVVTATELQGQALEDIETVRAVDVGRLLTGERAEAIRAVLEQSDPAAIRDYLEQGTGTADKIRAALSEAGVSEDEVSALILLEDNRLIVLYGGEG